MTEVEIAKAKVLAVYPDARFCPSYLDRGMIISGKPGEYQYHGTSWGNTNEAASWVEAASRLPARVENIAQDFPKGEGMSMFIGGPLLHGSAPVEPAKPKRVVYDAFGKAGRLVPSATEQTFEEWFSRLSPMEKCPCLTTNAVKVAYLKAWNAAKGVKG